VAEEMKAAAVAAWVNEVLPDYAGRYEVVDHLFIKGSVRVVTTRRDAFYDISRQRWTSDADPTHATIGEELRRWAHRVMPAQAV
jgi:hypothetical protein